MVFTTSINHKVYGVYIIIYKPSYINGLKNLQRNMQCFSGCKNLVSHVIFRVALEYKSWEKAGYKLGIYQRCYV